MNKMLFIAIACLLVFDIANASGAGSSTQNNKWAQEGLEDDDKLWTWKKDLLFDQMPKLAVHQLVIPVLEKQDPKKPDRFPVELQQDALVEIKKSAVKHGLNLDKDTIYPILVVGAGPKCGKAVALNAMLTADPNEPGPIPINDGLLNPQFPLSPRVGSPDRTGIWASDVFKRYGHYYILMMVRYPQSSDDVNAAAGSRLTALGHYLSSGMLLITAAPSFQHGQADLIAAAAALEVKKPGTKCRQSTIPTIGIRQAEEDEAKGGPKPFKDEFGKNPFSAFKGQETAEATDKLLQSFEPIGDALFYEKMKKDSQDFCPNPGNYFRRQRTSTDPVAMAHCESYRAYVGAGEQLMKHVIGKKRTATFNGLKLLLNEMIPRLNHHDLDSKSQLSQIGENVCGTTINNMIEEDNNALETSLATQMFDQSDSKIAELLKEFEIKFMNELESRLGTVWTLIEYGCDDAFHTAFESLQKRIERKLKLQEHEEKLKERAEKLKERAEKEKEKELRLKAEEKSKELQEKLNEKEAFGKMVGWLINNWKWLLFGFIGLIVAGCVAKPCYRLMKCCNTVTNVGSKSRDNKKMDRKLNDIETMLDTKIRAMDIEANVPIKASVEETR